MTPEIILFPPPRLLFATDWRFEAAFRVSGWLEREFDWWHMHLGWDLRESWAAVEPARARGELPGLSIEDEDGQSAGWGFFVRHGDALHVASLIADDRAATAALLEGVLASSAASDASTIISFTRAQAPGLAEELIARGFDVEPYRYLEASTEGFAGVDAATAPWPLDQHGGIARLLEHAYRHSTELRPFAPNGEMGEWDDYVTSLVERNACGQFLPEASGVIAGESQDSSAAPEAALIATSIGPKTAHIAQVAVRPSSRGNGLGARLVCAAGAAVHAQGFTRVTLLVAASNERAANLYQRLGFRQTATFLAAVKRPGGGHGRQ